MTTLEFQTIDRAVLDTTTGGNFASRYIKNLKDDGSKVWHDAQATAGDLKAHKWGDAAKNTGRGLRDEAATAADALTPIRAL